MDLVNLYGWLIALLMFLHTPFTHIQSFCWLGLLWLLCIVARFGRWSVSMPAGRKANTKCPILFATECELKSLQAIWTERCEEEPCRKEHHTFQSSQGCKKNQKSCKMVCRAQFVKISERRVRKVRKTLRAAWEWTVRKKVIDLDAWRKKTVKFMTAPPRDSIDSSFIRLSKQLNLSLSYWVSR